MVVVGRNAKYRPKPASMSMTKTLVFVFIGAKVGKAVHLLVDDIFWDDHEHEPSDDKGEVRCDFFHHLIFSNADLWRAKLTASAPIL